METYTTQPGVQFYTGYYIKGGVGKGGAKYEQYSGLCLETQNYPDAPNKVNTRWRFVTIPAYFGLWNHTLLAEASFVVSKTVCHK